MPNIALVKPDGTVAAVYTVGVDNAFIADEQYGDQIARALPEGALPDDVLDRWFWSNGWHQQNEPTQNLDVTAIPIVASLVIE